MRFASELWAGILVQIWVPPIGNEVPQALPATPLAVTRCVSFPRLPSRREQADRDGEMAKAELAGRSLLL